MHTIRRPINTRRSSVNLPPQIEVEPSIQDCGPSSLLSSEFRREAMGFRVGFSRGFRPYSGRSPVKKNGGEKRSALSRCILSLHFLQSSLTDSIGRVECGIFGGMLRDRNHWDVEGAGRHFSPYPKWGLGHCSWKFSKYCVEICEF